MKYSAGALIFTIIFTSLISAMMLTAPTAFAQSSDDEILQALEDAIGQEEDPDQQDYDARVSARQAELEKNFKPINPVLQILLPGLTFDNSVILNFRAVNRGCPPKTVCVFTITRYLDAIYRYGASVAVIFAIVLIMVGGIQYMVGSTVGQTAKAKERITNAIIGLILVLSVNTILTFINPNITALEPLKISIVDRIEQNDFSVENITGGDPVQTTIGVEGEAKNPGSVYLISNGNLVHNDIVSALQTVALRFHDATNKNVKIADATRNVRNQASLFFYNCMQGGPCNPDTCNPLQRGVDSPVTGDSATGYTLKESYSDVYKTPSEQLQLIIDKAEENRNQGCPHFTGYTVDIWPEDAGGKQITSVSEFMTLENLMKENGFCRLYHEPWHFEYRTKAVSTSAKACDWPVGTIRRGGNLFNYGNCPPVGQWWLKGANFSSLQCTGQAQTPSNTTNQTPVPPPDIPPDIPVTP